MRKTNNNSHPIAKIVDPEPKEVKGMSKRATIIQTVITLGGLVFIVAAVLIFFLTR